MIRCIQVGRSTIQGPLAAGPYPDPSGDHGTILSMGRVIMGRLTESKRAAEPRMTNGIPALLQSRIAELEAALERIEAWEMPETGATHPCGQPMSYSWKFGSNGERDVIRSIARCALEAKP